MEERLGRDLDVVMADRNTPKISKVSAYSLGYEILRILEKVHSSGYIYNDLKPDNIIIAHKLIVES